MKPTYPHLLSALHAEFKDRQLWQTRIVVLAFGALSGLTVVAFTWLTEHAFSLFEWAYAQHPWWPLLFTPLCTTLVVAVTLKWAPGASGSGIPQVIAALQPEVGVQWRDRFVSLRLSVAKIGLTSMGLLGGLSLGREGPSVQIGAGIMHAGRRWLPANSAVTSHGLLIAGGSAGIAAAFHTPLGGIMFAIEELTRRPEQRSNGLLMAAIVLSGLMGISFYGNAPYFGLIRVQEVNWQVLIPAVSVSLACGLLGGLFSRLLTVSLSGQSGDVFTRFRKKHPLRFAAACGLAIAVIGIVSHGNTFGSGYQQTKDLLEGDQTSNGLDVLLKFVATWITGWSGVPGGIFAPSLTIGGAIGANVAHFASQVDAPTLIALGMAGFLAAVTQAPMTAFIIVMEMVDGYNLVLSLMACAMVSSAVSRMVSYPLYGNLTLLQLQRLPCGFGRNGSGTP